MKLTKLDWAILEIVLVIPFLIATWPLSLTRIMIAMLSATAMAVCYRMRTTS